MKGAVAVARRGDVTVEALVHAKAQLPDGVSLQNVVTRRTDEYDVKAQRDLDQATCQLTSAPFRIACTGGNWLGRRGSTRALVAHRGPSLKRRGDARVNAAPCPRRDPRPVAVGLALWDNALASRRAAGPGSHARRVVVAQRHGVSIVRQVGGTISAFTDRLS